ncbi:MAG TPA: histidinol-phosphate transaminase [Terriglobales bacterium]|nr:histidinol-phosphate transaminase [Terriglobales bacterium]
MASIEDFLPEHIRALAQYIPGKPIRQAERESGVACIKLSSNENPLGPSPRAVEAMRRALAEVNYYPDNDASELRFRLALRHDVAVEQVIVADGSTALIDLLARALLAPGRNAVTSERSFIVYPIAVRAAGGTLIQVPMRDHAFDLEAIARAITRDTRLIFLANPNNPTGTLFDAAATDAFLARVPDDVLVILDEAYCDYATDYARSRGIEYSHSLDYVRGGRNLMVLRTFSKAHGLAGARVGYGFGPPRLIEYLSRLRTAFSVSAVAEAGALAALDDEAHIRRSLEMNASGAAWLGQKFRELGIRFVPTTANFIYFDPGEDAAALARRLQAEGVIVRPLTVWGAPTALRVTIGTPEMNEKFVSALKKVMERAPVR